MSYKFLFCFVYLPLSLSFLGSVRCCHFVFTHGERPKFCMYVINVVYTYIYFFLDIYLNIDVVDVMDIKECYTSTYYKLPFSAVRCLIATLDIQCVYRLLRFCFVFVWCLWHLITHSHSRMASTKQHERKGKKRKEKERKDAKLLCIIHEELRIYRRWSEWHTAPCSSTSICSFSAALSPSLSLSLSRRRANGASSLSLSLSNIRIDDDDDVYVYT